MCLLDILNKWWNVLRGEVETQVYKITMQTQNTGNGYYSFDFMIRCLGDIQVSYYTNGVKHDDTVHITENIPSIQRIYIDYNSEITISCRNKIIDFSCTDCQLVKLDVSKAQSLEYLICFGNPFISIESLALEFANSLPINNYSYNRLGVFGGYTESIIRPIAEAKGWNIP